ncbi:hypothetical protein KBZ10_14185 [Streptomyces sp. F63]|uniref:hypothetical protein n=1 Tax=Streptomyces sp. F63 TaxID=2824887 RepID=UPI001B3902E2|nr:hypothetical protein [Streptomyces sp. F63]MBQ0985643.1 hypothetical protein [Streptomyces sp. F63]
MPTPPPPYPAIAELDALLGAMSVTGDARRRQLGMVRRELEAALRQGILPAPARGSLRHLLGEETLGPYLRRAESGALRHRLVAGRRPPTSAHTNQARLICLDLLREAAGLPALRPAAAGTPDLRPVPAFAQLSALRRQLDRDLAGTLSPGRTRLTAVLALVLDTAARSGELTGLRTTHLTAGRRSVYVERRPQHGTTAPVTGVRLPLSPLARAALDRWLAVRADLVASAHGTSRLWVSLRPNHAGLPDENGKAVGRPAGMPLEENGLITSYRRGRARYGLQHLLPAKLEQLRRAAEQQREARPG